MNKKLLFAKLKRSLCDLHTLGFYDSETFRRNRERQTDASPVGLWVVLIQHDAQGLQIIAYGHKSPKDVEK